jgi:hypothetical protein
LIQRILAVAALSIVWLLLWGIDFARPWVIQPLPLHVARAVFALVLFSAGVLVVLCRPSKATWGFFAFTLFGTGGPAIAYALALTAGSMAGALVFAVNVMTDDAPAWRRTVEAVACLAAAGAISLGVWSAVSAVFGNVWPQWLPAISLVVQICAVVAAPLILAETCLRSSGEARERLRWVLAGFTINACMLPFILTSDQAALSAGPHWLIAVLSGLDAVVVALTVSYGLLKQPIVDLSVAISWLLTYAVFAVIVVFAFAFSRNTDLAIGFALALTLGFLFGSVNARVERSIERLLLRQRHGAREHLKMVIDAMPLVVSQDKVDRLTIEEPVHSLELEGGTLLWYRADGTLVPRHEFGRAPPAFTAGSHENALAACLQNERHALRLNQHGWDTSALAVPVFSNGTLIAIALYGSRRNGTDLDVEEIAIFETLASAAGTAYGRIHATALRAEVLDLRAYESSTLSS